MDKFVVPIPTLVVPIPPSVNSIWRKTTSGMKLNPKYSAWKIIAAISLRQQASLNFRVTGPYSVWLLVNKKMRGDIDNRIKAVVDLLKDCRITDDDRFAHDVRITRLDAVPQDECWIFLKKFDLDEIVFEFTDSTICLASDRGAASRGGEAASPAYRKQSTGRRGNPPAI